MHHKAKLLLFKSFILPHLTCCHFIWRLCKSSDKRKLGRIQERALRAIYRSFSDTYEELLGSALQDIAVLRYKVKHGLTPATVSNVFVSKDPTHSFRSTMILYYRVLTLHAMANILLDILNHFYGQNLVKSKEIRLI